MGIDISESMLNEAMEKAANEGVNIHFEQADVRNFELNKQFALIFFPFNSICHLHDFDSINACFKNVKKHLKPGGRFIIEVFNPDFKLLLRDKSKLHAHSKYKNPYNNTDVVVKETNDYNSAEQINYIKKHFNIVGGKIENDLNMRIYFPQELDNYLMFSGFEIEEKYGGFDKSSFTTKSAKQIIICKVNSAA